MAMSKTTELVEAPPVTPSEFLEQIRERRRIAERDFNEKFADVTRHRMLLQRSINTMEAAKHEFHIAQETEAAELLRLGFKK
jgi:hypothetical protein